MRVKILLCIIAILVNCACTFCQDKVLAYFNNDSIHLYIFGLYGDNGPIDTWYYFGEYGQVVKTRRNFEIVTIDNETHYQCLEEHFALHGDVLYEITVVVNDNELKTCPFNWTGHKRSFNRIDGEINLLNQKGQIEGFGYRKNDGLSYYGYYHMGKSVGIEYAVSHGSFYWLYKYGENGLEAFYMWGHEEGISVVKDFNTKDFTLSSAYEKNYYNNGNLRSEGSFVYDDNEGFIQNYSESGIWKYYTEDGCFYEIKENPIRTICKGCVHKQ